MPKLTNQDEERYTRYKDRAVFYGTFAHTVHGKVGLVTRKTPVITLPAKLEDWKQDVTLTGVSLEGYISQILHEVLITGRCGVLVERSVDGENLYLASFLAEDIVNWRADYGVVQLVVLQERSWEHSATDPYEVAIQTRYRELFLDGGIYKQRIWTKVVNNGKSEWVSEEIMPNRMAHPLDHIPFTFFGVSDIGCVPGKPPMLDLAYLNLAHYRNSADFEQKLHILAAGTPWAVGIDMDEKPTEVGPEVLWSSRHADAKFGIMEYSSSGGDLFHMAMAEKKDAMSSLGAKLIEQQRNQVETAETARLRISSQTSVLANIVKTAEVGLANVLKDVVAWELGDATEVSVMIPKDFLNDRLTAQEISALVQAWQNGAISFDTLTYNLNQGEIYPEDFDLDSEAALLKTAKQGSSQFNDQTTPADVVWTNN
ncbi:MAG: DUF4055 domain-containing protein [SAR324 cluster bacterium]|nr:DUF4055 domain-containing protein [SAR324 cluster bacterium]